MHFGISAIKLCNAAELRTTQEYDKSQMNQAYVTTKDFYFGVKQYADFDIDPPKNTEESDEMRDPLVEPDGGRNTHMKIAVGAQTTGVQREATECLGIYVDDTKYVISREVQNQE